jgi:hypothetical protein
MTAQPSRILPSSRNAGWVLVAAAAVAIAALFGPQIITIAGKGRLHGPDLALFAAQPMILQLHILAALGTVGVGGLIFSLRKGQAFHRTAGWIGHDQPDAAAGPLLGLDAGGCKRQQTPKQS